jgi:hypothetical protein
MTTDTIGHKAGKGTPDGAVALPDADCSSERVCSGMAAGWRRISTLASSCKYGVVLSEQQLLDALLGV